LPTTIPGHATNTAGPIRVRQRRAATRAVSSLPMDVAVDVMLGAAARSLAVARAHAMRSAQVQAHAIWVGAAVAQARHSIPASRASKHKASVIVAHRAALQWEAAAHQAEPPRVPLPGAVVALQEEAAVAAVVAKENMMNKIMHKQILAAMALASVALIGLPAVAADAAAKPDSKPSKAQSKSLQQTAFASPEAAAQALYAAVKTHDVKSIYKVLGPGSAKLIYTGDPVADQQMHDRFIDAYDKAFKIDRANDAKAILLVGEQESPFPFPLVKVARGWQFDAKAGAEEIINRRIGENELHAIKACLAYGDAQQEYAEADRDGDGIIEYAQKFRSSEGKHDGLYWPVAAGEPASPLGPLFARVERAGYKAKDARPIPVYGYYYRILTGQGKDAPGGAYDYLVKGNMIGGYALVAYPARWGASGVMTFTCNQDGVVYQKNLGANTAKIASKMTLFNPDASWKKAE
jgi:hypothetical protein